MTAGKVDPHGVDAKAVLAFTAALADCRDASELRLQLGRLPALTGADSVLVTECRRWGSEVALAGGDPSLYRSELLATIAREGREHPVLSRDLERPARGVRRLSDFVAGREWRRGALFNEFYRPLGMARELSIQLAWGPAGASCCLTLHRAGRDFGERERATLDMIAPHLRGTRARIAAEGLAASRLALLEGTMESVAGESAVGDEACVLPTEERLARALPISRREAEVLACLASGASSRAIADELGISRHTVLRHLEKIYAKLGVHSRVAATRIALEALQRGQGWSLGSIGRSTY